MKTIVFDVDGVLADFSYAFTGLAEKLFGTIQISDLTQDSWDYVELMTPSQRIEVWDVLKETPDWWTTLLPIVPDHIFIWINDLTINNEVYFLTNRFSHSSPPGKQTMNWLKTQGISNPRVIVSSRKGEIVSAIKADFAIEDNWSNACAIHWMADGCRTFLIKRGYNEMARKIIPKGIKLVDKVGDFLMQIEEARYAS